MSASFHATKTLPVFVLAGLGLLVLAGLTALRAWGMSADQTPWWWATGIITAMGVASVLACHQRVHAAEDHVAVSQFGRSWRAAWADIRTVQVHPTAVRFRMRWGSWRTLRLTEKDVTRLVEVIPAGISLEDLR